MAGVLPFLAEHAATIEKVVVNGAALASSVASVGRVIRRSNGAAEAVW